MIGAFVPLGKIPISVFKPRSPKRPLREHLLLVSVDFLERVGGLNQADTSLPKAIAAALALLSNRARRRRRASSSVEGDRAYERAQR